MSSIHNLELQSLPAWPCPLPELRLMYGNDEWHSGPPEVCTNPEICRSRPAAGFTLWWLGRA